MDAFKKLVSEGETKEKFEKKIVVPIKAATARMKHAKKIMPEIAPILTKFHEKVSMPDAHRSTLNFTINDRDTPNDCAPLCSAFAGRRRPGQALRVVQGDGPGRSQGRREGTGGVGGSGKRMGADRAEGGESSSTKDRDL